MTKTLTLAALCLVGSVAATASLLHEPKLPGQDMASTAEAEPEIRRGTRAPLAVDIDAEPSVGDQPRRGERGSFEIAGNAMAGRGGDALRRGNR
ncbi:hypothetical protein [uncultured Thiohalocapsa sp.]|uniref:hypothetical protein n=1 Tax=uncultured Thiohalocapsa sp. TaxID=768990 RepID=UPI0025E1CD69|nr:hypothetical protein [uncultured Thiohalocapsa sp.]